VYVCVSVCARACVCVRACVHVCGSVCACLCEYIIFKALFEEYERIKAHVCWVEERREGEVLEENQSHLHVSAIGNIKGRGSTDETGHPSNPTDTMWMPIDPSIYNIHTRTRARVRTHTHTHAYTYCN